MTNIIVKEDASWIHYYSEEYTKGYDIQREITGKYLIFSPNLESLEEIAVDEIENHGFHRAKTSKPNRNAGKDYVLCLYDYDGSRIGELKQRIFDVYNKGKERGNKSVCVKFKPDIDTDLGIYSQKHKDKFGPSSPSVISTQEDIKQLNKDYEHATRGITKQLTPNDLEFLESLKKAPKDYEGLDKVLDKMPEEIVKQLTIEDLELLDELNSKGGPTHSSPIKFTQDDEKWNQWYEKAKRGIPFLEESENNKKKKH